MKNKLNKLSLFILSIVIITFVYSCQNTQKKSTIPGVHTVVVQEILQTSEYTYLRITENDKEDWLAVTKMEAKVGETLYYKDGTPMQDFRSRELNRTFKSVVFVEKISASPDLNEKTPAPAASQGSKNTIQKLNIKVDAAKGGITIEDLFKNKKSYDGKTVKIRGQVSKFSPEIMNKNWIHLQDGTSFSEKYDLTVTSAGEAKVGQIITIEGKVALEKDFGFGYFYDVIIEDVKIIE